MLNPSRRVFASEKDAQAFVDALRKKGIPATMRYAETRTGKEQWIVKHGEAAQSFYDAHLNPSSAPHAYIRRVENPNELAEYNDDGARRMREQFKRAFPSLDDSSVLDIARKITQDSGSKPRLAHYAEALQYASVGDGDTYAGLREVTKEVEPARRGGGPSPAAKRATYLLQL